MPPTRNVGGSCVVSNCRSRTPATRAWLARIAARTLDGIVIVAVSDIVRIDAEDNYVRIHAGRPYLHRETLGGLATRLDPARFLRVHRSHVINIDRVRVRELQALVHGEYRIVLTGGGAITSSRSGRARIQAALGFAHGLR
ncbi:MAG: LytTR family DNA-binding domain-containing protein [Casimicrobiaceae bacterium]